MTCETCKGVDSLSQGWPPLPCPDCGGRGVADHQKGRRPLKQGDEIPEYIKQRLEKLQRELTEAPKLRCPNCGRHNSYGGDPDTYPCSSCGFDGRLWGGGNK